MSARGGGALFLDTVLNDASWAAALGATGAVLAAVDHAHRRGGARLRRGAAAGPPRARVRGPWASAWSPTRWSPRGTRSGAGRERVLIVDWDVHHGNGTQALVEHDATIRYVSLHQHPWYPGTGHGRRARRRATSSTCRAGPARPPARYVDDLWAAIVAATDGLDARPGAGLRRLRRDARRSARRLHPGARALRRSHAAAARAPARRADRGLLEGGYVPARLADGVLAHALRARLVYSPHVHRPPRSAEDPVAATPPHGSRVSSSCAPGIRSSSRGAGRATTGRSGCGSRDARRPRGLGRGGAERVLRRDRRDGAGRAQRLRGGHARRIRSTSRRPSAAGRRCCACNAVGPRGALRRAARPRRQAARRAALPALGARSRRRRRGPPSPSGSTRRSGSGSRCGEAARVSRSSRSSWAPIATSRSCAPSASATDKEIRVDANCGWTVKQAIAHAAGAAGVRRHRAGAAAARRTRSTGLARDHARAPTIPVIADESCRDRRRHPAAGRARWTGSTSSWPSAAACARRSG